jgi:hypothetical protein
LSACPSFRSHFCPCCCTFSDALSRGQSHHRAAGVAVAGRVAFGSAP